MNIVEFYTDGGYRSKCEIGAYAYVAIKKDQLFKQYKKAVARVPDLKVTNITMEMNAVLKVLKFINGGGVKTDDIVYIITDSQFVQLGITEWSKAWRVNNWKNSKNKTIENYELWREILDLYYDKCKNFKINIQWTRGHNGDKWNEYVDKLCNEAMDDYIINN